jgi:ABC-type branched-subunit amino acid transport system ATPase component
MLKVENLHAGYGSSEVLNGVSLHVKTGQVVALIGANGAGKTTTMRAISGMIRPTSGSVLLDGKTAQGLGAARIARIGLAHAPEGRKVFGPLSVEDNLLLGAFSRLPHFFGFHAQAAEELQRVYALFPRLLERRGQAAGTLSGGEQQMLAIARALMAQGDSVGRTFDGLGSGHRARSVQHHSTPQRSWHHPLVGRAIRQERVGSRGLCLCDGTWTDRGGRHAGRAE